MEITQKPHMAFFAGIPTTVLNEVRQNDPSFYISYNRSPRDYGCATTALVLNDPQMTKFYILRGDHRKQYEAAETWDNCLAYYQGNPTQQHEYSDKVETL